MNHLSIPKLQLCNRWSLGWISNFISHFIMGVIISMLRSKLVHVSERSPWQSTFSTWGILLKKLFLSRHEFNVAFDVSMIFVLIILVLIHNVTIPVRFNNSVAMLVTCALKQYGLCVGVVRNRCCGTICLNWWQISLSFVVHCRYSVLTIKCSRGWTTHIISMLIKMTKVSRRSAMSFFQFKL